jgi:hypothetical protein
MLDAQYNVYYLRKRLNRADPFRLLLVLSKLTYEQEISSIDAGQLETFYEESNQHLDKKYSLEDQ